MNNSSAGDGTAIDGNLNVRAATACARARQLIAECARLHADARQRQTFSRSLTAAIATRRADLALSVAEYTRELRDGGTAPERVIVQLKMLVDDTCFAASVPEIRVLRDDIVAWGIESYFAA